MFRLALVGVAGTCLVAVTVIAEQKPSSRPRAEFVELDAVVVDDDGRSVRGLRQADFEIDEDGRPVAMTSFAEVSASGITDRTDGRSVVLLLDDTGTSPVWASKVQEIARTFVARMRPADDVSVVRMTHGSDEAAGDRREALTRIAEFQGGAVPWFGRETIENSLKGLARLARQLESVEHRRKVVVCIGALYLCDFYLPPPEELSLLWRPWTEALSATARANVAVYVVDPSGDASGFDLGGGVVERTGGAAFVKSNNFARAVDRVWDEAGHYYLLGYAPTARARELHSIDVQVRRPGLHVRARRSRGD